MMRTFTTVVNHTVTLGIEAWSIEAIVDSVRKTLLSEVNSTHKTIVTYGLLEKEVLEQAYAFHLATISLLNLRGRVVDKALVYGEQPMVPGPQAHANNHRANIACRECGSTLFYNIGRSLFYENHICANCKTEAHTLTETGAST